MTYSTYKTCGNLFNSRVQVKVFSTGQNMHNFLNKQRDNEWKINDGKLPAKSGTYAYAGGEWHNVKSLDSSVLANI